MSEVKLNKNKDNLEVYDDDGIYWYSITPTEMQELGVDANEIMTLHSLFMQGELMAKVKQANKRIENQPADDDAIPNNWQELQARDMEELANEDFSEPNQEGEFDEELRIHNKWERI